MNDKANNLQYNGYEGSGQNGNNHKYMINNGK